MLSWRRVKQIVKKRVMCESRETGGHICTGAEEKLIIRWEMIFDRQAMPHSPALWRDL